MTFDELRIAALRYASLHSASHRFAPPRCASLRTATQRLFPRQIMTTRKPARARAPEASFAVRRSTALEALFLTPDEIGLLYEIVVEAAQEMDASEFKASRLYPIYCKLLKLWEGERP